MNYKLIYRRYQQLYCVLCVDVNDNDLSYLESIHAFVELLDQFFANVNELDLVLNFHKVYALMDEFFLGGEMMETNRSVILGRAFDLDKLE
jgi:AP-2 complex subunit sigma-1